MREMRKRIMTEGWRRIEGALAFSVKQVELRPSPGEVAEGHFELENTAGEAAEGFVRSSDGRMECLTPFFSGGREQIEYRFDAGGMQDSESREGRFFIVSNLGEYELPWKVKVMKKVPNTSVGEIRNLFHFTNLARASWKEAVKFFYTKECKEICGSEQEEMFNLYRGFSGDYGNEENVEEFLIAIHKKQPITFSAVQKEIVITDIRGRVSEELQILRNGWGPVRLSVETKGDFLTVEKSWLTDDDFLGNLCRLPVFLDENRMHEGNNFAEVCFRHSHGSFSVPVTVRRLTLQAKAKDRRSRDLKKCNLRLVRLYQELRMKRIDMDTWRSQVGDCIETMAHLMERSPVPKLFSAQLLITQDRMEEAGWILDHVEPFLENADPAVYCYYLYLTTLYNREESYVKQTTLEVEECYARNAGNWRIAWLILFLSRELNRSASKKWQFLEKQFEAGCLSPVLYLEALTLLNASPTLLTKLEGVEKRILIYGAKNGMIGPDLTGHVIYLINREKYYDPVLYRILELCWKKRPDTETLQAVCTLLIKGSKTGTAYYPWYLRGVQKKLRITRLYEYFLMSADREKLTEIPKIVLLYFAYQSNLDYECAAWLYAYVLKHREEDQELYLAYRPQIDRFVTDQLYKGRINRHLSYLYREMLTKETLTKEGAAALAQLLCSVEVTCKGENKKLVVVNARLKGEKVYLLKDGKACVDIYGKQDMVFTEDEAHNRRLVNEEAQFVPLFAQDSFREELSVFAQDSLPFHLAATDAAHIAVTSENAGSYLALVKDPILTKFYGQKVRSALLAFFFENDRMDELDKILETLDKEDIAALDRAEAARFLVLRGFHEKAYEWFRGMDAGKQDARILMRLCSRLLERQLFTEEEQMTRLCFEAAVHGKYDSGILQQLTDRYEGSVREMEAVKTAAEGFGVNTYPLCERIMEQMLYAGMDVTERMDLLRQYVQEGGRSELESAFLHRCAYSYVMEGQPIHAYMIHDILRMYRLGEKLTDMCRIAFLQYYAKNRSAVDEQVEKAIRQLGGALLQENRLLPVLKEFADIVPGAQLLLDKTFVVYQGSREKKAVLNYRVLQGDDVSEDYQSVEMMHVYEGIYVMTFILFPGESLQYYVTEAGAGDGIADSGLLRASECTGRGQDSRYGMLSNVAAQQLAGQRQSLELLNRYLYTEYCVNELFGVQQ